MEQKQPQASRTARIGVVCSRYNSLVTDRLLEAAIETAMKAGVNRDRITVLEVPGAFEIPLAAKRLASIGNIDAVICLGCLIQGETDHYHFIAAEVTRGIGQVALDHDLPVSFGVITARSTEQAFQRAGGDLGNKGREATEAALRMMASLREHSAPA